MNYISNNKYSYSFLALLLIHLVSYGQQSYDSALPILQEFCSVSSLQSQDSKDFSNITAWVDHSLEELFFGLSRNSISSRNSGGYIQLSAYDKGEGINIPLYDDLIVFSPTASSKRKISETLTRNKYSIDTECELAILNYCHENYVKSFDYSYYSYFETGTYVLSLSLGQVVANTINKLVDFDYKKDETGIEIFVKRINEKLNTDIEIPKNDNDAFKNLIKTLKSNYTYEETLQLIFKTFIEKDQSLKTEKSIIDFYSNLSSSRNIFTYIDDLRSYKLKIGMAKGGVIKVSKNIFENIDPTTKEVIDSTGDYLEIPVYMANATLSLDNNPRLVITFEFNEKEKPLYNFYSGIDRALVKGKFERVKITKEKPVVSEIDKLEIIYYNDRIQVRVSSSYYGDFHVINVKRDSLLPKE